MRLLFEWAKTKKQNRMAVKVRCINKKRKEKNTHSVVEVTVWAQSHSKTCWSVKSVPCKEETRQNVKHLLNETVEFMQHHH